MLLKHYNLNHEFSGYITASPQIDSELRTGDKTLTFTVTQAPAEGLRCEEYIQAGDYEYTVKEIHPGAEETEIVCKLNLESLESIIIPQFTAKDMTAGSMALQLLDMAELAGWSIATVGLATKQRSVQCFNKTPLEIIYKIRDAFMCEVSFNPLNKSILFQEQLGRKRGVYLMSGLNLRAVSATYDSYDFATVLIPHGLDGLTIESVNDGKDYIENYSYSTKKRVLLWEDTSYEDPAKLKEDAILKLQDLAKPKKSFSCDVLDLAKLSREHSVLSYGLGDTVTLIDALSGIHEKQRIVKLTEYPDSPEENSCEISNTTLTWEELQARNEAAAAAWEEVSNSDGTVKGVRVVGVQADGVVGLEITVNNTIDHNETVQNTATESAATAATVSAMIRAQSYVTRTDTTENEYTIGGQTVYGRIEIPSDETVDEVQTYNSDTGVYTTLTEGDDYIVDDGYLYTMQACAAPVFVVASTIKTVTAYTFGAPSSAVRGQYSVQTGTGCQAAGDYSLAGGADSIAGADRSIAYGHGVTTSSRDQAALGRYNARVQSALLIVGNGSSDSARSNALYVDDNGDVHIAGKLLDMNGNEIYKRNS